MMAGLSIVFSIYANEKYYLYRDYLFWTRSSHFSDSDMVNVLEAEPGFIDGTGTVACTSGVLPVINLRLDILVTSKDGSSTSPYVASTT